MNVVIDRGNTRTKVALFNSDNQIDKLYKYDSKSLDLEQELSKMKYEHVIFSSVAQGNCPNIDSILDLDNKTPLPIKSAYKSATLGVDRLALAVAVNEIAPNTNCLAVDLGSALTIDFISSDNVYMGGCISPGMSMRFASLHDKTGRLPMLSNEDWQFNLCPDTTEDAIRCGVIQSVIFEIERYIERYENIYEDLSIFFTGGDAIFFAKQIKKGIFANENLVLTGLNRILNYNNA